MGLFSVENLKCIAHIDIWIKEPSVTQNSIKAAMALIYCKMLDSNYKQKWIEKLPMISEKCIHTNTHTQTVCLHLHGVTHSTLHQAQIVFHWNLWVYECCTIGLWCWKKAHAIRKSSTFYPNIFCFCSFVCHFIGLLQLAKNQEQHLQFVNKSKRKKNKEKKREFHFYNWLKPFWFKQSRKYCEKIQVNKDQSERPKTFNVMKSW